MNADFAFLHLRESAFIRGYKKEKRMDWGIVLLCIVLGSLCALRPSGRAADFRRVKED